MTDAREEVEKSRPDFVDAAHACARMRMAGTFDCLERPGTGTTRLQNFARTGRPAWLGRVSGRHNTGKMAAGRKIFGWTIPCLSKR